MELMETNDAGSIEISDESEAHSTMAEVAYLILRAGHCVRTKDQRFAQILIPAVQAVGSAVVPGSTQVIRALVMFLRPVKPKLRNGKYPELPVPWLKQDKVPFMFLSEVEMRVHIAPTTGETHRPPGDTDAHYLFKYFCR
jgi:hypothetical protein